MVQAERKQAPRVPPSATRRKPDKGARAFGLIGMSLGAHMAVLGALGFMPTSEEYFAAGPVEMEVIEPPPPPPPPPPELPPEPKAPEPEAPKPKPAPRPAPQAEEPPPPTNEPPKAAPEAPLDFTGVTLTGDTGSSWSSVVGTGAPITAPIGRIAKNTGRDRAGSAGGIVGGTGTAVVSEASLSRKPVPPGDMNAQLEQNFPPRARMQGVSGVALLRVRIQADGRVGDMQIVRETGDYGFGNACMKTLRARRWQPPLDRRGQPVATDIRYSCEFEVGD
jgi:protein TonB